MIEAHKNLQFSRQVGQEIAYLESQLQAVDTLQTQTQKALDQLAFIISYVDQIEALIPEPNGSGQSSPAPDDAAPSQPSNT